MIAQYEPSASGEDRYMRAFTAPSCGNSAGEPRGNPLTSQEIAPLVMTSGDA